MNKPLKLPSLHFTSLSFQHSTTERDCPISVARDGITSCNSAYRYGYDMDMSDSTGTLESN